MVAMKLKVEVWGDNAVVKLPESLLQQLGVGIGDTIEVTTDGNGIKLRRIKPKFKLADLIALCDLNALPPTGMKDWDKIPPVGKEFI